MGGNGKRFRSHRDDVDSKNQKRRVDRERDRDQKGNDELIVYRILCPDGVIGSVIGKSGKVINSIRQETRAKVKVLDPFPGLEIELSRFIAMLERRRMLKLMMNSIIRNLSVLLRMRSSRYTRLLQMQWLWSGILTGRITTKIRSVRFLFHLASLPILLGNPVPPLRS